GSEHEGRYEWMRILRRGPSARLRMRGACVDLSEKWKTPLMLSALRSSAVEASDPRISINAQRMSGLSPSHSALTPATVSGAKKTVMRRRRCASNAGSTRSADQSGSVRAATRQRAPHHGAQPREAPAGQQKWPQQLRRHRADPGEI